MGNLLMAVFGSQEFAFFVGFFILAWLLLQFKTHTKR